MRKGTFSLRLIFGAAALISGIGPAAAADSGLNGRVSSTREGVMEGVLVSAKLQGSTITTTVVSGAGGLYGFPAGRLSPGRYDIAIRAAGYELGSPAGVTVLPSGSATADISLVPARDLAAQLTNSEWLASAPGEEDLKKGLYTCMGCHTLERVFRSEHSAQEFARDVLPRMVNYSSQAFPGLIQVRKNPRDIVRQFGDVERVAAYLASINLSGRESWDFPLQTFTRPAGASTRVIITEYDLPRAASQPHDVIVDENGLAWYSNFGENMIGRLDPASGAVKEFNYAPLRPGYANGNLDLEIDREGHFWIGMMNQTGFARFDRRTEQFEFHPLPAELLNDATQTAMVGATQWQVDGKIWYNDAENRTVGRMDMRTGRADPWWNLYGDRPAGQQNSVYGIYPDSGNNLFFCNFSSDQIGRIDAKTGAVSFYQIPTPWARPRRGRMDSEDRLWFAEWRAGKVAMFDTKTGDFTEWDVPGSYTGPYDAVADRNGEIWTGNMNDDRISRIDSKTGRAIRYLMPHETNVRRVFVDNSAPRPVFWVGSNHTASIFKVEPLE